MTPKIEHATMPLADLIPAPYNPRTISDAALAGLGASIARWGLVQPVVWNRRTGRVVGGHQRVKALSASGATEADVVVVDLPEIEEKALNVALNSPTIAGEFTEDLDALLREVAAKMPDVYAAVDLGGLEKIAAELVARAEQGGGEDPGAGDLPASPVSELGEMFELGPHRLLCGDSTDPEVVARVMAGERAVLMATDPPYGVAYTDEARVSAERNSGRPTREQKWATGIMEDDRTGADIQPFLEACFTAAVDHALAENAAWYLWHAQLTQAFFAAAAAAAAAAAQLLIHRQIIWVKPSLLFGHGDYHWRHELAFYGWRQGHRPPFYGERNQTTVWELTHETSNQDREHPTQKPVEIFEIPMRNHVRKGEVVYEPFAGSGTQIIAAARHGARCMAVEKDPRFVDVIRRRWTAYAKQAGIDPGTGALE